MFLGSEALHSFTSKGASCRTVSNAVFVLTANVPGEASSSVFSEQAGTHAPSILDAPATRSFNTRAKVPSSVGMGMPTERRFAPSSIREAMAAVTANMVARSALLGTMTTREREVP